MLTYQAVTVYFTADLCRSGESQNNYEVFYEIFVIKIDCTAHVVNRFLISSLRKRISSLSYLLS